MEKAAYLWRRLRCGTRTSKREKWPVAIVSTPSRPDERMMPRIASAQSVAECYWRSVTVSFSPTRDHSSTRPVLHVTSFATNP